MAISGTPIAQMPPTTFTILAYTGNTGISTTIQITVNEASSQGIVAQDAVFAGSILNLASFPSSAAQSFEWTLTNQSSGGTITAGSTADLIQYTANTTPGTYQLSVTTQAASGNPTTVSRTLNVVNHQFLKDPATSWDRGTPSYSLLANGTILFVGSAESVGSNSLMGDTAINSTEIFDPLTATFSAAATMALPRKTGQAQVTFANGKVLVCGGLSELIDVYGSYETSASLAETEIYDPAANAWTAVTSMNAARSGHTATLLQNGQVLVAGGKDANGNILSSAEIYDPIANTWTTVASLTTTRIGHSAILLNNGTVLVTGGTDSGSNWLNSAEIYAPAANTWTAAGSMQATSGYTTTLLKSGKVLFAGGLTNGGYDNLAPVNTAEIYDPVAGTWNSAAFMSTALAYHTATLLSAGTVLVAGGEAADRLGATTSAAIYDPVANTWTSVASLNISRYNHLAIPLPNGNVVVAYGATYYLYNYGVAHGSAETYNPAANTWTPSGMTVPLDYFSATPLASGQVLFAGGGSGETDGIVTNLVQTFNPATNTWSIVAPLNTARENHTATLLQNGKLLVVGGDVAAGIGYSTHPAVLSSVELYDPTANTWTAQASLITGRTQHTATLLLNGKVLVAGGSDSNGNFVSTTEVYDPNANSWTSAGSLINPRTQHTATLLNTGKVLLAGGWNGTYSGGYVVPLGAAELYDPSANSWTAAAAMPAGVYQHTATLLNNGTLAIIGGYPNEQNGYSPASAGLQLYNPTTNAWSQGASMNNSRAQHAATLLSTGQILVTGGMGISSQTGYAQTVSQSEIYTPSTNTWTLDAPLNLPRYGHFSILLNDERVMIVGGEFSSYIPEFWKQ
jgi:N-acetylneuraminic acid mutarotase